jgi:hypothetical protein
MRELVQRQLAILMELAPNGKVQAVISNTLNQSAADGATDKEQLTMLLGVAQDGLKYGNWPTP